MRYIKNCKQLGFVMMEILIVIGVILSITAVTVYAIYNSVNKQHKTMRAVQDISQLVKAAHTWRLNQPITAYINDPQNERTEARANLYNYPYACIGLTGDIPTEDNPDCSSKTDELKNELSDSDWNKKISLYNLGMLPKKWKLQADNNFNLVAKTANDPTNTNDQCYNSKCFTITMMSHSHVKPCDLAAQFWDQANDPNSTLYPFNVKPTKVECTNTNNQSTGFELSYE